MDAVLVDMDVIASCPIRYAAAGILDAMAKRIEIQNGKPVMTLEDNRFDLFTAFKMSEYTYDVLEKYGPQAIEDIRCHKVTKAVEDITFINIAVTGVIANITKSFSQSALGHMMYDGVRTFFTKEAEAALHGEIVAVALFAQLYYNQLEGEMEQLKRLWNVWTCPLPWMTWAWRAMRKTLGFWKNISLIHLMWGRMRKASGACTGPWGRWGPDMIC